LILPKGFPGRYLGLLLFVPALVFQTKALDEGEFKYTLLDVGQGYASVLQTRDYALIYDAGTRISDSFDLGKLVVSPYLHSQGIDDIDVMMISHEDIDHRGGAQYVANNFAIKKVIRSGIKVFANKKQAAPGLCKQGQNWQWNGVNFQVLSPDTDFTANDNNRSCVLKVWNQHHSLLLTGDIVPHHGSKTSSSVEFLRHVSPKIALISAGYRSRYGHPKPSIVKRYQDMNIELLDTVTHGAITLHFAHDETAIKRQYYRLDNQGFWNRQ